MPSVWLGILALLSTMLISQRGGRSSSLALEDRDPECGVRRVDEALNPSAASPDRGSRRRDDPWYGR